MRSAGNFHPEWGYLAPAPSFMRTVRIALVATAIGAVAGAVVVVSLVERPGSNDDNAIAAHALLTRAPVIGSPALASRPAPVVATSIPPSNQPQAQPPLSVATSVPLTPPAAAVATPATTPPPNASKLASADPPGGARGARPPLPLPAPTDAIVAANAPSAETVRVPAEADAAVAPDPASEPRTPVRHSVAKKHHYEPYRRQETVRSRWRENSGFGPLLRLFSFRTGAPFSSN
jgi:hypothetical protein